MKILYLVILASLLVGCATSPRNISPTYVSPLLYKDYSCEQLTMEMQRVSRRAAELYGSLDQKAGLDSAQMGIGLLLFWPALFFLEGGDGMQAAQYSRIKGESETLEQVAIQKNCGIAIKTDAGTVRDAAESTKSYHFQKSKQELGSRVDMD